FPRSVVTTTEQNDMGLRDKARESASKTTQEAPVPEEPVQETREPEAPQSAPVEEELPKRQESAPDPSSGPEKPAALEPSVTYLVEEERPDLAYSLFIQASSQGMRGMIVSRTYPKNLRKALNLKDTPVYWLTNAMSDEAIGPKDLERLTLTIRRFLEEGGVRERPPAAPDPQGPGRRPQVRVHSLA
ncbi:MAG: DUF835 domain-containing protein, partial [Thermoplasmata archaeon]|nr:DUF835 domain-containing protein [Thermoplasmata archaeon]